MPREYLPQAFAIVAYTGGPEDFLVTTHGVRSLVTVMPQSEWLLEFVAQLEVRFNGLLTEGGEDVAAMRTARLIAGNEPGSPHVVRIVRVNTATGANEAGPPGNSLVLSLFQDLTGNFPTF